MLYFHGKPVEEVGHCEKAQGVGMRPGVFFGLFYGEKGGRPGWCLVGQRLVPLFRAPPQAAQAARSARCSRLWVCCCIQHLGLSLAAALQDGVWDRGKDWTGSIGKGARDGWRMQQGRQRMENLSNLFSVEKTS